MQQFIFHLLPLLILVFKLFQVQPVRDSSSCLICPIDMPGYIFDHFLISRYKIFQPKLYLACPNLGTSRFSEESWFILMEIGI